MGENIQLTFSAAEASGSWKKKKTTPKPGFFRQLSGLAGWELLAAQPGRRWRHNHVRTRQLKGFLSGLTCSLPPQEINRGA